MGVKRSVGVAGKEPGWMGWCRLKEEGRGSTIEDAGYCGVPYPEIRCSDRHLADAEDISLRLSFRIRPVPVRSLPKTSS